MARTYETSDDSVVVVIGSGAGGATLANELAQKGIDVVCLEAGNRLALTDIENDPGLMIARMGWNDERLGAPVWLCKTVGGTTMRWTAIALRIQAHEFTPLTTYGRLSGTSLIDWPLTLEELAPYYDQAERKMGVTGTHGLPPGFENSNYKVLRAGGRELGYRDITTERSAINPVAYDGRPGCRQIGFCISGCRIGAKWSTLYTEVPKAEATGHFELRTGVMAVRVNHDDRGRVTGVVYAGGGGNLHEQKARAVAVAGNVVETTRLLLNSSSARFPDGLANSSGQLGRNYMRHTTSLVYARMPGEVNFHKGPRIAGLIMDERRHDTGRDFAGGYYIETAATSPDDYATRIPGWGAGFADHMEHYNHMAGIFISGEDPPEAANRITLHPERKDAYGLPVPVLEYSMHDNSLRMQAHANARSSAIFESLGGTVLSKTDGVALGCHNMGVARMSADPDDGVTNRWGQAHDVPNLFVSDGSVFTSSAAANPTLTITALAIRQAEHIATRMSRREL